MKGSRSKNGWVLLLLLLSGVVLGGFLGTLADGVTGLSWLNYGQSFGLSSPIELNLGIIFISFALQIKITIAGIIGVILGGVIYRFI